jgi:photosystem II stability/assembly factor-like uncharacterized protein
MRTLTGIQDDWERILGGDGFYVLVDPEDSKIIYAETQWGRLFKSTDGGFEFNWSLEGVNGFDRVNWNTPYVISPHNRNRLYYGTHRLYTSVDGAQSWDVISEDLTNTDPSSPGGEGYGALSTIAVAESDSNVIYTGSEDGHVFVTLDNGDTWTRISDNLPERYITRVAVDPYDAMTAFVTLSGYRDLDYLPHLFLTSDGGENWTDISGNLPEVPLNDVIVDPDFPGYLYVASDLGVWYTADLGLAWYPLGENLPMTSYADLRFHPGTRKLLAASFGLSQYVYDLSEPVTGTTESSGATGDLHIFPNPAEEFATIEFSLARPGSVSIILLDLGGRQVAVLKSGTYHEGEHRLHWEIPDHLDGVYVVSMSCAGWVISRILNIL